MQTENRPDVTFVDELPERHSGRQRGPSYWKEVAAILRSSPSQWAIIETSDDITRPARNRFNARSAHIRNGKLAAFRPAGSFDASVRRVGDAIHLYARYVGDPVRDA